MKTNEEKKAFYAQCGEILGIEHVWIDPVPRRTRWNNRNDGNGRFPGFGVIHCFGHAVRVISHDTGTQMFFNYDETYKFLEELMKNKVGNTVNK